MLHHLMSITVPYEAGAWFKAGAAPGGFSRSCSWLPSKQYRCGSVTAIRRRGSGISWPGRRGGRDLSRVSGRPCGNGTSFSACARGSRARGRWMAAGSPTPSATRCIRAGSGAPDASHRGDRPNVKAVAALLGHTDIRTTLCYVYTDTAQMRLALSGLPPL